MATFRVNKDKDYIVMSKTHLKDKKMSLKAKGLLSEMLSLPDDWDYSIGGLVAINKENESAIKSTLTELKEFGYLKVTKLMPNATETGRIEYIYDVYEKPKQEGEKQEVENLPLEIQHLEIQPIENPTQLNNNKLNNNKLNIYNIIYYENSELNDLFVEYLKLRKRIKAINTDRAIKSLLKKLEPYTDDIKMQMIEEALVNSWKSVYPLKNKPKVETPKWVNENITRDEMTDEELEELRKELNI